MCLFEGSNKFALLWDEAQLCLPYVFIERKVTTYSDPNVTYSHPKMTKGKSCTVYTCVTM